MVIAELSGIVVIARVSKTSPGMRDDETRGGRALRGGSLYVARSREIGRSGIFRRWYCVQRGFFISQRRRLITIVLNFDLCIR